MNETIIVANETVAVATLPQGKQSYAELYERNGPEEGPDKVKAVKLLSGLTDTCVQMYQVRFDSLKASGHVGSVILWVNGKRAICHDQTLEQGTPVVRIYIRGIRDSGEFWKLRDDQKPELRIPRTYKPRKAATPESTLAKLAKGLGIDPAILAERLGVAVPVLVTAEAVVADIAAKEQPAPTSKKHKKAKAVETAQNQP
jgi:hypothetical protein